MARTAPTLTPIHWTATTQRLIMKGWESWIETNMISECDIIKCKILPRKSDRMKFLSDVLLNDISHAKYGENYCNEISSFRITN